MVAFDEKPEGLHEKQPVLAHIHVPTAFKGHMLYPFSEVYFKQT